MKGIRITYWIFTGLIFLLEGVVPALTFQSAEAKQGILHLGYPEYFGVLLTCFKIIGALILILPMFKGRIKEWAYAGFTFDFVCAGISITMVDGFAGGLVPIIALVLLAVSYFCYHKLNQAVIT